MKTAVPNELSSAVPIITVPLGVALESVTVPVGIPLPLIATTVTRNATGLPNTDGFIGEMTVVWVRRFSIV